MFSPGIKCIEAATVNWGSSFLLDYFAMFGTPVVSKLTSLPYQMYENTGLSSDWTEDYYPVSHGAADHPLRPDSGANPLVDEASQTLDATSDPRDGSAGSSLKLFPATSSQTGVSHASMPPPLTPATDSHNDQRLLHLNNTPGRGNDFSQLPLVSKHRSRMQHNTLRAGHVRADVKEHSLHEAHEYHYTTHPVPITKDSPSESLTTRFASPKLRDPSSYGQDCFEEPKRSSKRGLRRGISQNRDFDSSKNKNPVAFSQLPGLESNRDRGQKYSPSHDF